MSTYQRCKEVSIDGDDYLRFRLARRFEGIVQGLYDAHKKEAQSRQGESYLEMFEKHLHIFQSAKDETGSSDQACHHRRAMGC